MLARMYKYWPLKKETLHRSQDSAGPAGTPVIKCICAQVSFIPLTTWDEVAAAPEPDFGFGPRRFHMTCCRKQAGGDIVHWEQCRPGEVFTRTLGCDA